MSVYNNDIREIIIDEEFMRLLPPLDKQEFCNLEESILEYGCMNPLVLWNNILIDGHNRFNIVKKHNLPYNTISLDFNSRDEAIAFLIKIQIDRRNLTPMQLTYFRGLHYNIEKKIHGGDRRSQDISSGQNDHLKGTTASRLSKHYKISPKTIRRDAQIADVLIAIGKESQEAKNDILLGNTRINRKQLREMASDSEEEIAKIASDIATGTFIDKNETVEIDSQKGQDSGNKCSDYANNNILISGEPPIQPGKYRHYKGNHYMVIGFAKHSETLDDMVIYRALYGENGIWVRPLSMWEESVEDESGNIIKRFEYIEQ